LVAGLRREWTPAHRRLAVLTLAFLTANSYSLFLAGVTHGLPTIWAANAILVAGLLVLDRRHGAALLAMTSALHITLELLVGDTLRFAVLVTLVDVAQIVGAAVLMRALRLPTRVRSMRGLLRLTAVATVFTIITCPLQSGLLTWSLGKPFSALWSTWMTSNVLGMTLALPTTLILLDRRLGQGFRPTRPLETAAGLALVACTAVAVFSVNAALEVLLFAPVMLATFWGGPRAAAMATAVSLAVAIPTVIHKFGLDPAVVMTPMREAQVFHLLLCAVCLTAALALSRQARLQALLVRRQAVARAAKAKAQAANQAKSDFLATMSHEIRTPLNSILGFAALVAEDPSLSAENRRRLDLVGRAGHSLAEIVNDLLDFARVEAGRLDLVLEPVSPAALLRDTAAIIAPAAKAKGLALSVTIQTTGAGDEDVLLALDETRLRQVLLNLLANALKFTAEGHVDALLVIGPGAGDLRFEVSDTGIGISREVQARLFRRFSQADSSITRSYGGTGLGLAISKALVSQMDGAIGVDSTPGEGSCFWVSMTAQVTAAAPSHAAAPLVLDTEQPPRVLLVDDHPMNRELGHALLTLAGCDVATVDDGAQAVEAARHGEFDLILMDVHMPGMDGLAATRAIRAFPGPEAAVPIIALSADVLPEQIARCRLAGMDDHVAKPIRREALLAAVARALRGPDAAAPQIQAAD
jgi:signal transduction histidine kinase/ActR/RegA family two-component response regulator